LKTALTFSTLRMKLSYVAFSGPLAFDSPALSFSRLLLPVRGCGQIVVGGKVSCPLSVGNGVLLSVGIGQPLDIGRSLREHRLRVSAGLDRETGSHHRDERQPAAAGEPGAAAVPGQADGGELRRQGKTMHKPCAPMEPTLFEAHNDLLTSRATTPTDFATKSI
jgi:hypothetical protein